MIENSKLCSTGNLDHGSINGQNEPFYPQIKQNPFITIQNLKFGRIFCNGIVFDK